MAEEEKEKEKKPIGRPSKYNQDIADKILFLFSTTTLSLEQIINQLKKESPEEAPDRITVWRWQEANEDLRNRFSRARELHADVLFDAAQEEANNERLSENRTTGERGGKKINESRTADNTERSKLRVSTLLKSAANYNPKRYSEKVVHAGDSDAPITILIKHIGSAAPKEAKPQKK
jgi:hypothetical protein